jgi:DNA-directed RNA polymerase subunit RPC12/RpoP
MSNIKLEISNLRITLRILFITTLLLMLGLMLTERTQAQGSELELSLKRNWGFGGMGNQMQGLFTMSVNGGQDVSSVSFELDSDTVAIVTQPPFKFQFNTDRYPHGKHTLSATARMSDGRTIKSNVINVEFVSAEAGWQVAQRIVIPLVAVIAVIAILATVGPLVLSAKGKRHFIPGEPRNYGSMGGAICPRCGRPFALNFLSLNLLTRKLERCPYCGKWSFVSRASPEALEVAEASETGASNPAVPTPSLEEKLRQQLEESRYQ